MVVKDKKKHFHIKSKFRWNLKMLNCFLITNVAIELYYNASLKLSNPNLLDILSLSVVS